MKNKIKKITIHAISDNRYNVDVYRDGELDRRPYVINSDSVVATMLDLMVIEDSIKVYAHMKIYPMITYRRK